MNRSGIPYLTHTWSPTTGCSPVSVGCENCWAASYHRRWRKPFAPTFHPEKLDEPLRLRKPAVIGVSFMGDLFHEEIDSWDIKSILCRMNAAASHRFLVLTKRPRRMQREVSAHVAAQRGYIEPNVYLGVSVEDQATADERIPILLDTPAAHRWVSLEPQIGPVALQPWLSRGIVNRDGTEITREQLMADESGVFRARDAVDWVIQGCESGARRRPFDIGWARSVRDQCAEAGCAYYLKQMPKAGDGMPLTGKTPLARGVREKPTLDGRQHLDLPWEVRP